MAVNINLTNVAPQNPSTSYTTPLDADKIGIWDTLNSLFKYVTWLNLKATLKTYFDTLYKPTFSENTAFNKNFGTTSGTVAEGDDVRFLKNITLLQSTTTASHTGGTTETVLYTGLVPANTFTTHDKIFQEILATAVGIAGIKTIRTYFNTTANLAGTPVLFSTYFTNNLLYSLVRGGWITSTTTMKGYLLGTSNLSIFTGSSNGAMGTFTIDWAVDQYLVLSVQLASAADAFQLEGISLKRERV